MRQIIDTHYMNWLSDLKAKLRSAQSKAVLAVNRFLIEFYWDLGKSIAEKENIWGSKLIEQVAKDLQAEFPEMKGLSLSNLKYCKRFYVFYQSAIGQQAVDQFVQQAVAQIPWGHNILIFSKSKTVEAAQFYISAIIENGWSREVLALQLKSQLYERQGKAVSNFKQTLPEPLSDLAQQTLKDPYVFDFLTLSKPYHEKDIERQLITHITKFLLELGKGFAFIGRQYHLAIGETDYYIDLLFYHTKLKCYVVIELKNTRFMPEYAGKLNFYLSAVDSLVKQDDDKPTIGILLCRDKNNIETEFALRDINKPMGVSEFLLTEIVPDELKSSLPSIEEIENELKKFE
jgi:predicted nuclease of restriction endonuclease-like (RecB) superfamily